MYLGFNKSDIDDMSFIELAGFVEKGLEIKNIKEHKEVADKIVLIRTIHSNADGLNDILRGLRDLIDERQNFAFKNSDAFNPTTGSLC